MKPVFCFVVLVTAVSASNVETIAWLRNTFWDMTEMARLEAREREETINFNHVIPDSRVIQHFHKFSSKRWSFTLVATETETRTLLPKFMMDVASYVRQEQGFCSASSLLSYSLWSFFTIHNTTDLELAAFYLTRDYATVQIANTGIIWAGLFREGRILEATFRPLSRGSSYFQPESFFKQMSEEDPDFANETSSTWQVRENDIIVLTNGDLPDDFDEIVRIAVEIGDVSNSPVSQIAENLSKYFSVGRNGEDLFAAVRIT